MSLDSQRRAEVLAAIPAFSNLDAAALQSVASELDEVSLAAGEVLMRQGDSADALYFVTSGELQVSVANGGRSVVVDSLSAGSVIGEMALLAGDRRSATVTALGPVSLVRFERSRFDKLCREQQGLRELVIAAITPRLERVQLASVLEAWFGIGSDDTAAIRELQAATKWLGVPAGATLYRSGDDAEGMYLVVSGRLQVTPHGVDEGQGAEAADTKDHAGDYQVARGESVGELGVLGGISRTETVTAVRDSHVLLIPTAVVEQHPAVMARIARSAVERFGRVRRATEHGNGVRTFALLPAHPGAPVRELAHMLIARLSQSGSTPLLDEASVAMEFGGALPGAGSGLYASLTHWLNELETENSALVLMADHDSSDAWVDRCRRQADAVLLVADAGKPPPSGPARVSASADVNGHDPVSTDQLVLLHPATTETPRDTAAWLTSTGATSWHHVRLDDARSVERLVRRLTGTAVGLVFSGGGARGYAHIGLLRAIDELGVEIDMLAGTSMGALIAAVYSYRGDWSDVERAAVTFGDKKRLLDKTLPIVALTRSQGVTDTFRGIFGDARIEDLWTPFVCVSANLFEAVPVEHSRGSLWEAVRASTAIPGIFTPFVSDGALLVDGAVMNSFPVDVMRAMVGRGTVIASSAMAKSPRREPFTFGPSVSGWSALAQYFKPSRRRTRYPTMIKTLMEATSVGSKHLSVTARTLADLVVELPVQEFSKLEFERHEELIELGYRHALAALGAWLEQTGGGHPAGAPVAPLPSTPALDQPQPHAHEHHAEQQ